MNIDDLTQQNSADALHRELRQLLEQQQDFVDQGAFFDADALQLEIDNVATKIDNSPVVGSGGRLA